MDDFNNKPNPFDEEGGEPVQQPGQQPYQQSDPYNQQPGQPNPYSQGDPYNLQPGQQPYQQSDPYNQQPGQPNPYSQGDPYNQQPGQQPYGQSNPYGQQQSNPYNHQPGQNANPYGQQGTYQQGQNGQPQYNPYAQPGYQYQQGYGQAYAPYQQKQSSGMAVASMVLGIISICLNIYLIAYWPLMLVPIIGIVLGIVHKSKKLQVGKGMSTAGIITSIVGIVLAVAFLVIVAVMLFTNGPELMNYLKEVSPEDYEELYELYKDTFPEWFESVLTFLHK